MSEDVARDSSEDWLLPEAARPRSFAELEAQIELAVKGARASEAAVAEVGAAAIEAAEQARQAADLAAQAASVAQDAATRAAAAEEAASAARPSPPPREALATPADTAAAPVPAATSQEEWLLRFTHRAERLSARLVRLQHC